MLILQERRLFNYLRCRGRNSGALCGSVMLDQLFQEFLTKQIGKKKYQSLPGAAKQIIMHQWQNEIKHEYSGPNNCDGFDAGYYLTIPGPKIPGTQDGMLYIENNEIQEIFDNVIDHVRSLISEQKKNLEKTGSSAKAIILVGGLGSSEYLYRSLEDHFEGIKRQINLDSGAVIRGLQGNSVQTRKSRCHYGIACSERFDPFVHSRKNRIWCQYEEQWMASSIMRWYINKGESLAEEKPIRFSWYRTVGLHESLVFHEPLRFSIAKSAPSELEADLNRIPKELFDKHRNSRGEEYYRIHFDMVMTPTSASLLFDLEFNNISYGTVRAKYY
ncbi:hypothetical protein N7462_004340 [Penicillium macrosclerotiorum]|uniref:uncharacterized protein n=1 Tax=Penicillium macrosclerotiorum TaxID=303699 RepID=UPI0025492AF9|nr:uncharacterized protein N7462_004340 [Penicillium macrosclerotiorum]KAJ5689948.1 hypothetical protein N7462_004340 [Penicillium macrosclerotiorum]